MTADTGAPMALEVDAPQTVQQRYSAFKPFIIISTSYLLFTTTDGAVRMIVLFNACASPRALCGSGRIC